MAASAHHIALRNLSLQPPLCHPVTDKKTNFLRLLLSVPVVEIHCNGRPSTPAVRARNVFLSIDPLDQLAKPLLGFVFVVVRPLFVVLAIVGPLALRAVARQTVLVPLVPVEAIVRECFLASRASFHASEYTTLLRRVVSCPLDDERSFRRSRGDSNSHSWIRSPVPYPLDDETALPAGLEPASARVEAGCPFRWTTGACWSALVI
jgi:hypothetical protein